MCRFAHLIDYKKASKDSGQEGRRIHPSISHGLGSLWVRDKDSAEAIQFSWVGCVKSGSEPFSVFFEQKRASYYISDWKEHMIENWVQM